MSHRNLCTWRRDLTCVSGGLWEDLVQQESTFVLNLHTKLTHPYTGIRCFLLFQMDSTVFYIIYLFMWVSWKTQFSNKRRHGASEIYPSGCLVLHMSEPRYSLYDRSQVMTLGDSWPGIPATMHNSVTLAAFSRCAVHSCRGHMLVLELQSLCCNFFCVTGSFLLFCPSKYMGWQGCCCCRGGLWQSSFLFWIPL